MGPMCSGLTRNNRPSLRVLDVSVPPGLGARGLDVDSDIRLLDHPRREYLLISWDLITSTPFAAFEAFGQTVYNGSEV